MIGTSFNNIHTGRDLHVIQQSVEIEPAEPKTKFIDVPGADGGLDMTEALGRVRYKDRTIKWTFALYPGDSWAFMQGHVSNLLNGRRMKITMDDDPDYYYEGRLTVSNHKKDKELKQIEVTAIVSPYKMRQSTTRISAELSTTPVILCLTNERRQVAPKIKVTAQTKLTWGTTVLVLDAGTHEAAGLVLEEGKNYIQAETLSGTGSIVMEYREGSL